MTDPTADQVVAAAHFGVLATLSTGVMGALHQFTPVVTQRPLRSVALAWGTFVTWLGAAWLLPSGIAAQQEGLVEAGGGLAAVAVTLLVVNLSAPLNARGKGHTVTGLRLALAGFAATACFGVTYVADRSGDWFDLSGHAVLAHAVIGLFAWLGLTYVAVAEKLWPMFFLAHVPGRHRAGRLAVWLIPAGVALLSPGLLAGVTPLAWAGAVILAAGLAAHLASLAAHIRHRRRKGGLHLAFVATSAACLAAGAGLALAATLVMSRHQHAGMALAAAAVTAFAGWLLEALAGHAHKVVPFILWSVLNSRLGKIQFWLLFIGYHMTFLVQHWIGVQGMPRRVANYPLLPGDVTTLNVISSAGSWILALSILVFLWNIYVSWRHGVRVTEDDPWGYCSSLEWATSCPPPRHNFYRIPRIRSERPAFELHYPHIKTGRASLALTQTLPAPVGNKSVPRQP